MEKNRVLSHSLTQSINHSIIQLIWCPGNQSHLRFGKCTISVFRVWRIYKQHTWMLSSEWLCRLSSSQVQQLEAALTYDGEIGSRSWTPTTCTSLASVHSSVHISTSSPPSSSSSSSAGLWCAASHTEQRISHSLLTRFTVQRNYTSALLGIIILSVRPSVCHTRAL